MKGIFVVLSMFRMIPYIKYCCTVLLLAFSCNALEAQKPVKGNNTGLHQQKFKPPKVKTTWGNHSDSAIVSPAEAIPLLSVPLRVTDDKNTAYALSSYQFMYRKQGVIGSDESESGKTEHTTTIKSQFFRSSPLPELWVKTISEEIRSGEELYVYDIVAKDNQGHLFFAPSIRIRIN